MDDKRREAAELVEKRFAAMPRAQWPNRRDRRTVAIDLQLDLMRAKELFKQTREFLEELADAWQRGSIQDYAGKFGYFSNTNAELLYMTQKFLSPTPAPRRMT